MRVCQRCGAEPPPGARYCIMCGYRVRQEGPVDYGTATLSGSGVAVAIATAGIVTAIVVGVVVLVQSFL